MSDDKLTEEDSRQAALIEYANRWASFPTDDDVERMAEALVWPGFVDASVRRRIRAGLEAVKQEDR
jgi:hypothetical protein